MTAWHVFHVDKFDKKMSELEDSSSNEKQTAHKKRKNKEKEKVERKPKKARTESVDDEDDEPKSASRRVSTPKSIKQWAKVINSRAGLFFQSKKRVYRQQGIEVSKYGVIDQKKSVIVDFKPATVEKSTNGSPNVKITNTNTKPINTNLPTFSPYRCDD